MTTTFITGDRQMSAIYPGQVALEVIRALNDGHKVATGENGGVEALVRSICDQTGVEVAIVCNPDQALENGKVDWDTRHDEVTDFCAHVVAIHADPHTSSIIRSLVNAVSDEALTLRTPADLLA